IYFKNRVVHNNLTMMRKMRLEHNATRKTSGAANKSSTLRTQTALDTQKQHFAACVGQVLCVCDKCCVCLLLREFSSLHYVQVSFFA
ncbi:MAG: hypothetical protein ACK56I_34610, partial [bacterium]